jgi:hypothetical protein
MGTRKTPAPPGRVAEGDRVRIDRIKPYDRKPGLAGVGFTYDNPDRMLPVKRAGHLRCCISQRAASRRRAGSLPSCES